MHQFQMTPGTRLHQQDGYAILSGLSRQFPNLHGRSDIQIAPVRGTRREDGSVITDMNSYLHIRGLSSEEVAALSGSWFQVHGSIVGLGRAEQVQVDPVPNLSSRIVVFANAPDEASFLVSLAKVAPVGCGFRVGRRSTIEVKGRHFIGYGVHLTNLTSEQSLEVLSQGLGKYTSMGCGVFSPTTRNA